MKAKVFVAWELDDNGEWINERRVATLAEGRQNLADGGCFGAGQLICGKIFFGESWKRGLSSVQGEISIECRDEAKLAALLAEAAKPLPTPSAEARDEYDARPKTYAPPTAEEQQAADERDHNALVDEVLAQKAAEAKNA